MVICDMADVFIMRLQIYKISVEWVTWNLVRVERIGQPQLRYHNLPTNKNSIVKQCLKKP